jgi:hypothetical protein
MKLFLSKHRLPIDVNAESEYTPLLMSHLHQLYDESEGSEYLDDAIRMYDQPLLNAEVSIRTAENGNSLRQ